VAFAVVEKYTDVATLTVVVATARAMAMIVSVRPMEVSPADSSSP
jgi:hypothetical protein